MDKKNTVIYLDMDGVLADFFSEYAKLAGVTTGTYRDIPPAKVDPTLNKMIGTDFFARLPVFKTVPQLMKLVLNYVDSYSICSSPLRGDHKNSEKHKRDWIAKHLNPQPEEIIITGRKHKWATQPDGTPNILIDDRGKNISDWIAAGGYGIKYQADEDSLETVKMGLDRFFKGDVEEPEDNRDTEKAQQAYKLARDEGETESYTRAQLPQIGKKELKNIDHTVETVDLEVVCPVQKERLQENLIRQFKRLKENTFQPIVVDKDYRIVNGHHRYEVLKQLGSQYIEVARINESLEALIENFADGKKKESITEKTQSPAQWQKAMIKKYGEDGWYDIADAVRDYYESNAILDNTISDIIKIKNDHPSFTDYSGITKLYRYEKKDKNSAPTDDTFIPFAYNIKGAKNFVQSMAQGNMGFKKSDFELVEKDFNPGDAILNFTNLIELVHNAEDDDGEWYKREYEVWMKRTPYYAGTETNENFADGKKPGRKGISKRVGIPKGATISQLEKYAKSKGEKGRMARWQLNMRRGKKKDG